MAFCSNCGAKLSEGAKFCASCGTPVSVAVPASPPAVPSAPVAPSVPVAGGEAQEEELRQQDPKLGEQKKSDEGTNSICPDCGAKTLGWRFCHNCGRDMGGEN